MNKIKKIFSLFLVLTLTVSCSVYNFTGTGKIDAKTFQVIYFQNVSELVEPGIDRDFTYKLQNLIQNQTNLNLTTSNGDLVYEGEIIDYRISPMTSTADLNAAENQLTITVNVRFSNSKKTEENYEKKYTFFKNYPANTQLVGSTKQAIVDEIFDRITQDIFNDSLAKW